MALVTAIPLTSEIPTPTLACMADGSTDWHQDVGVLSVRMVGLVQLVLLGITSVRVLLVGKEVSAKLVRSWWCWIFVKIYDMTSTSIFAKHTYLYSLYTLDQRATVIIHLSVCKAWMQHNILQHQTWYIIMANLEIFSQCCLVNLDLDWYHIACWLQHVCMISILWN